MIKGIRERHQGWLDAKDTSNGQRRDSELIVKLCDEVDRLKMERNRPDATGIALLQARHMFNEMEDVTDEVVKLGMDGGVSHVQNHKYRFLKVHYYSFGLFWMTLFRTLKNRQDLKKWSPELFALDEKCLDCDGLGKLPIKPGTPEYDKSFEDFKEPLYEFDEPMKYGAEISNVCSPCQGIGLIYKRPK